MRVPHAAPVLVAWLAGVSAAPAAVQTFDNQLDFLLAAGPLRLEDFETTPRLGDPDSLPMLAFDGWRATTVPAAIKVLDTVVSGNHSVSTFGPQYLGIFAPILGQPPELTLEFEPPVTRVGFWIIDLEDFDMGLVIHGVTHTVPAGGSDGAESYFGIISTQPIDRIVFDSTGAEISFSLDDLSYPAPPPAVPAGAVPDGDAGSGLPLSVSRMMNGDVALSWDPSCGFEDDDYEIYAGTIGDFASHEAVLCSTGGMRSRTLTPLPGNRYYLVVPRTSNREGSYGTTSSLAERSRPASACLLQQIAGCP